ncbi:RnfABCDGE type electron transport complex subunit D [Desulfobacter postgatei]|uniref:RnfABCDGE type electron transport complex subunit D n=1 Tax=Desulfobacter postgatei TaxID=2293 RepID=UPI002A36AA4D|nr:RnfABCDGE type electron transport complex subunit D [Desulfobacter postgatei]MDX9962581.1 RnfABCDGE type electron transport complex subunit D [Desulfobacter postgatei]
MTNTKLIVSHAPFWHSGDSLFKQNLNFIIALLPAAIFGILKFGAPALGVLTLAASSAMLWEVVMAVISKRKVAIADMESAVIGLLFGMMVPATMPWWVVITGTFVAIVLGKFVFGGTGGNPFHPTLVGIAILTMSWPAFLDFDTAYVSYQFNFTPLAPLAALKSQGPSALSLFSNFDLLMGNEVGGIGSTFGLGIIIGGIYLILKGYTRWEVVVSFIVGILITSTLFYVLHPDKYAPPLFHLFSGYTLLGAFFLAVENSSSPVYRIPMFVYGFLGGLMIILVRNIGIYPDGTVLSILLINLVNPLIDVIKPKALGKGVPNA